MALIGWESANSGFNSALQTQAVLNVKLIFENMDVRYPGDWSLQDGKLYKGDHRFGDNQVVADKLGEICQGHVTFFAEDVSVSTNLKKANGERNVGTKASAEVADIVIKGNKEHSGMVAIDGIDYLGAYVPLRNASGQAIGMLFVGIGSYIMDDVRHQFLMVTVVASILVILILSVLSYVAIGRSLKPIEDLTESLGRIAKGDLRVADLDESREDEIGILAHSTNAMKNRLREVMSNVSRSAETVAASSEQLTASTQETLESITHVAQNTKREQRNRKIRQMLLPPSVRGMRTSMRGPLSLRPRVRRSVLWRRILRNLAGTFALLRTKLVLSARQGMT